MPAYLLHGFRWSRDGLTGIRVRTILNDLEDVSADYIQNPSSQAALLGSFRKEFPEIMRNLPNLILLEQYDPEDVTSEAAICQPYAFVGDKVVTIAGAGPNTVQRPLSGIIHDGNKIPATHGARKKESGEVRGKAMSPSPKSRDTALSVNVEDVMASGPALSPHAWEALADLRDKIATGEKIGWFVLYNGDPDRHVVDRDEGNDSENGEETVDQNETTNRTTSSDETKQLDSTTTDPNEKRDMAIREKEKRKPGLSNANPMEKSLPTEPAKEKGSNKSSSANFKKFFGKKERSQS